MSVGSLRVNSVSNFQAEFFFIAGFEFFNFSYTIYNQNHSMFCSLSNKILEKTWHFQNIER